MSAHAFVDETKRRGLVLVSALLASGDVAHARRAVEGLHLRTQRRIHFKDERLGRKRTILDAVVALPVAVRLYECPGERQELAARQACLVRIVEDLTVHGGERLVIERDDSTLTHDRRTLYQAATKVGAKDTLSYHHLRATEEALLALPDIFGWCWAKGGDWRRRVLPTIADHVRV